ncbi:MAG TPA: protein translocase subunit SecD [Longimicrobiaceae bacterium]|nr:protein translocase subunit SecD [Longimicrobiaceae bacterium]
MFQNLKVRLGLIALLAVLSVVFLWRNYAASGQIITLGLDLQGGSHYALELDESRISLTPDQRRDAIDRALKVVRLRVEGLGVSEPVVQKSGDHRIIVELAGLQEHSRAKEVLQKAAFLEFQIVRPLSDLQEAMPRIESAIAAAFPREAARDTGAADAGGLLQTNPRDSTQTDSLSLSSPLASKFGQGPNGEIMVAHADSGAVRRYLALPQVKALLPRGTTFLWGVSEAEARPGFSSLWFVTDEAIMTGEYLQDAQPQTDQFQRPIVVFELGQRAGRRFETATTEHLNQQMAIVLDDRVYTAPVIRGAISTRGQIELGDATLDEATDLALVLRAGALPAPLKIVEERSVGPSLGADSVEKGKLAGIIGIGAVIALMLAYYRLAGLFAVVGLTLYVLYILGIMAALGSELSFPGIAGLILSIGMAVDANVLIFERIREEQAAGRPPRPAVQEGFKHALSAIVDSNLTTLITAVILYYVGVGPIRGFAVTLGIGIIASMFTAIFVVRTIFLLYLERRRAASTQPIPI